MKLALFNDYVPGVVNGDRIIDSSSIVGPVSPDRPASVGLRNR